MYLNFQKSWNFFIFCMKFLKFIKIELETSVMHENWAKFMQNLTSWWQNMIFYQKKLILKGGSNLTPPRYTSIKIDVGIRRVKNCLGHHHQSNSYNLCKFQFCHILTNFSIFLRTVWAITIIIKVIPWTARAMLAVKNTTPRARIYFEALVVYKFLNYLCCIQ